MPWGEETALLLFAALLALALAALIAGWLVGRQWGDLSSRRHYGETLSEEELAALRRSRRSCVVWATVSLGLTALSFLMLR